MGEASPNPVTLLKWASKPQQRCSLFNVEDILFSFAFFSLVRVQE
jgi:hypothetical protein